MKNTEKIMLQFKSLILAALKEGRWDDARGMLDKYKKLNGVDADIYSIESSISILQGSYDEALTSLKSGYRLETENINLLINFGTCYEKIGDIHRSLSFYRHAMDISVGNSRNWIQSKIAELSDRNILNVKSLKIIFFVKPGLDTFLDDIVFTLMDKYEVRKCIVNGKNQIDEGMDWADICWFEFCNELVVYGSHNPNSKQKKIICRLHRFEVFSRFPKDVIWENINNLVVVTDHLRKLLINKLPGIQNKVKIVTINNGLNTTKYNFSVRSHGYNIAYICYIDSRKNPALLLQIIYKLKKIDKKYKIFVAGAFVDEMVKMYWKYQIKKMNLEENVVFNGWQSSINEWLEDKNYLLSTSIHESFGFNIAEAMSKGIKPVIHDFPFASEIWPDRLLFNTIDEACEMITGQEYQSEKYRYFIDHNYKMEDKMNAIRSLIAEQCRPAVVNE